ncbi:RagB/SusD family nutrient uptake outer membrane protein [uncultured Muribaculum sp.]|uniref:RagB/SusD family nutrient uptake outer membrane protein n=1 Tax=uncultured Muribaculum sp. TaxID=1918613 RepID=UPI0025E45C34|nr:RagB/SusD family nutrient uptake outer membrane protein [uncultured Muribaculum sp.]
MNKLLYTTAAISSLLFSTGCIEETMPATDYVSKDQAANAPGSFDNFVKGITGDLSGKFLYSQKGEFDANDFGYSAMMLSRDLLGNDIAAHATNGWWDPWIQYSIALSPEYASCQFTWTLYWGWIKSCNETIALAGDNINANHRAGTGIAYAMRALYFLDLARLYGVKPYTADKNAITVPIVTEKTTVEESTNNPRATNEKIYAQIISDLNTAEGLLDGYTRDDKTTPDLSVVYGLKARAYLDMGEWALAQEFAVKAQDGYAMMTQDEYLSRINGFNSPNSSWMLMTRFKADDSNILDNDADSSWGSWMVQDMFHGDGMAGYASNYGFPLFIDYHLYQTIPSSDFRKKLWIDFSIADAQTQEEAEEICANYSDYPDELASIVVPSTYEYAQGGISVKFRPNPGDGDGITGRSNAKVGFCVAVPMMRVEEMKLIEIEAIGRQNEGNGIAKLTEFALTRDPDYVYGRHNEAYGNTQTSAFINEVWWQRRVELWGEGMATFDIKRLQKGMIRSYAGSNHLEGYRWNFTETPQWMNYCIGGTDAIYNYAIIPTVYMNPPTSDSPEFAF